MVVPRRLAELSLEAELQVADLGKLRRGSPSAMATIQTTFAATAVAT